MWLVRDEDGTLCIGEVKPKRGVGMWFDMSNFLEIPQKAFKQITWKNEPVKVKVTIEIIEDGRTESTEL